MYLIVRDREGGKEGERSGERERRWKYVWGVSQCFLLIGWQMAWKEQKTSSQHAMNNSGFICSVEWSVYRLTQPQELEMGDSVLHLCHFERLFLNSVTLCFTSHLVKEHCSSLGPGLSWCLSCIPQYTWYSHRQKMVSKHRAEDWISASALSWMYGFLNQYLHLCADTGQGIACIKKKKCLVHLLFGCVALEYTLYHWSTCQHTSHIHICRCYHIPGSPTSLLFITMPRWDEN